MSYDNAEPKVLKTLNSSGQVLDDAGNVINDTSDYWVQLYNQTEPKADKILKSDGTVVDAAGNLIQDTTEFNVQKYNQAEPIPAKYLHSDGTIDENPGSGSGADLEDNHQTTIDVSTYTEPVEVTPISGKDGMKKNTVTLTNIPVPSDLEDNHQETIDVSTYSNPVEIEPEQGKDGMKKATITLSNIPSPGGATRLYEWRAGIPPESSVYYTTNEDGSGACLEVVVLPDGAKLQQGTLSSDARRTGNTFSLV